jgi:hypothetical protein
LHRLSVARGTKICYATLEEADYDFLASWVEGDTQLFCPVQLKELPPAELNANAKFEDILARSVKDPRRHRLY